ncbi:MAG: LysM peptidoglycan-binding domain-containing protein [Dehalococcoidia bacterium]
MHDDGLPSMQLFRGVAIALAAAVVLGVLLLLVTPTLPNEDERTSAAAPTSVTGPRDGGATPAATAPAGEATGTPAPGATPTGTPQGAQQHTIQSGDTLLSIAEQYDTTVDAIRAANPGLSETALQVDQEIVIPASR